MPGQTESHDDGAAAVLPPPTPAAAAFRPMPAGGSPRLLGGVMLSDAPHPAQVQGSLLQSLLIDGNKSSASAVIEGTPSLRGVLGRPECLAVLTPRQWDLVLRQARAAGLAGRLSYLAEDCGAADRIPAEVRRHLDGERLVADKLARDAEREVERLLDPLLATGVPVILLKGAAYIVGALPAARGRVFSDIDVLVPRDSIAIAERRLLGAGWEAAETDEWDQRFYRQWMHEIPPMVHSSRETVLDLHFTIVPTKGRVRLAPELLFEAARPGILNRDVKVLSPCDMVLHSAAHLFNEGDFDRGLRDLVDLDLLMRHFSEDPDFWAALVERGDRLGLGTPLYYTLRYASRFLRTPVPAATIAATRRFAPASPALMDFLFEQALRPPHRTARDGRSRLALLALFFRAHHLRLPLHLLIPHLLRKAAIRLLDRLPLGREGTEEEESDA